MKYSIRIYKSWSVKQLSVIQIKIFKIQVIDLTRNLTMIQYKLMFGNILSITSTNINWTPTPCTARQ